MKNVTDLHRLLRWPVFALLLGLLMAGCNAEDAAPPVAEDNEIGLQVEGLNYSGVPIGVFYVNDRWGGNVSMYAGGGGTATAIGLPAIWAPDLKVTIKWRNDLLYDKDPQGLYTTVVPVPKYSGFRGGTFWVAFLPNDEIKVFASPYVPGHPKFPDPELINPRQYCLIRPVCRDKYFPGEPVPEPWETLPIALQPYPPPPKSTASAPSWQDKGVQR
ncbi:MAG: DUF3304 domain-containing protein [Variovorax sp.]|nr:MAG: DUF3304 domain-containing protein [Variovorax sp.]